MKHIYAFLAVFLAFTGITAQNSIRNIQTEFEASNIQIDAPLDRQFIWAQEFGVYELNFDSLNLELNGVDIPHRNETSPSSKVLITLPNPEGGSDIYEIFRNTTMHPGLQASFPEIRTYDVRGHINRKLKGKIDITPHGFHAMVWGTGVEEFYIDPVQQDNNELYMVYTKEKFVTNKVMDCHHNEAASAVGDIIDGGDELQLSYASCQFRTYRIAISATGEYTAFHGGTVALAQAAQVTTMNRVNGIYEREMSITMEIIANNNLIVYTDANTDPFTNGATGTMINENQTNTDLVIGTANYDIGHIFGTDSGGLASLQSVCSSSSKARGVTGSSAPINDPFDVDYVAHEIGHQFGANHTQNNPCNSVASARFEPGSASTIMGYAGICAPNVQNNSDDYFHTRSLQEIGNFISGGGHTCPVVTPLSNQAPTISSTNGGATVPVSTPFSLTAVASDPNAIDDLYYRWEQYNNQASTQPPVSTATGGPNFRSFKGTTNPTRYFPSLSALINNGPFTWEVIPSVSRTMNFRVTVHDDHAMGGCSDYVNTTLTFDASAGPFIVTVPSNTGITWQAQTNQTVTWDVANTNNANVNCQFVDILLSIDGGLTYPYTLATDTPNDGSQSITVPNLPNTTSRVMVRAQNETFFDISNNNFTISAPANGYALSTTDPSETVCSGSSASYTINVVQFGAYNSPVTLSLAGLPAGATGSFTTNPVIPGGSSTLNINSGTASPGTYALTVNASSAAGPQSLPLTLELLSIPNAPSTLTSPANSATSVITPVSFSWGTSPTSGVTYQIVIATDLALTNIAETASNLSSTSYTANSLSPNTLYYWSVRAVNQCGNSPYLTPYTFSTASCSSYSSTNVPVSISASGTPTITSTLNIPQIGYIESIEVSNLTGNHTWIQDLYVTLTSPNGTTIDLFENVCGSQNNFNIHFSDNGSPHGTIPCPPVDGLTYQPQDPLSSFINENMQGNWTLTIYDEADGDGGALTSWGLNICYNTGSFELATPNNSATSCTGNSVFYTVNINSVNGYSDPVNLSVANLPAGATASFSPSSQNPGGSSTLNINNNSLSNGIYSFQVVGTSGALIETLDLNLITSEIPALPVQISPSNGALGVFTTQELTWQASPLPDATYVLQVSTDDDFLVGVSTFSNLSSNTYSLTGVQEGTTYYWRVRAENFCGSSPYTEGWQFTTSDCNSTGSSTVIPISASGTPTVVSTIDITQGDAINQVEASLNISHTYVSDLVVSLTSPEGTTVILLDGVCGGQDNILIGLSDAGAAYGSFPCPPIDGLSYQPFQALSAFAGENPVGTWTLTIEDQFNLDGGQLNSWGLNICSSSCFEPSAADPVEATNIPYCFGSEVELSIDGVLAPGAQWEWFSGSCGGTPIGTGSTITVAPSMSTDYYVRASAGAYCPESSCSFFAISTPNNSGDLGFNGNSAECTIITNNWTHFINSNGRLIASVNSNGQDLGQVFATSYLNPSDVALAACDDPTNPQHINAVLTRTIGITPEFQPTAPVLVRLYITEAEFNNYQFIASSTLTTGDNVSSIADLNVTKHSDPGFEDGNIGDICAGGTTEYILQSGSGLTNTLLPGYNNSYYLEFQVNSFSQFFPMNSNNSPLPVTLTSFEANCDEYYINIHWSTASETNADFFRLEKSRDGVTWTSVADIQAVGNSTSNVDYTYQDQKIANTDLYYRLVQVDLNGEENTYPAIQVNCEEKENHFELFPNPNNGSFTIAVQSAENFGENAVQIMDITGKTIFTQSIDLSSGAQIIPFENLDLAQGVYFIRIKGLDKQFKPIRFVVDK